MSYYVIVPIRFGTTFLWPGTQIDDATDDVASIQAAGGTGCTWSSADATVAAAALDAQAARRESKSPEECARIMLAAVASSISATANTANTTANTAAAAKIDKRTVTIGHADLTDAVNGEAQAINVGAVLPANAVVLAHEVNIATLFSGGGATAVKMDLGGTDADAILSQLDVFTGAATGALSPGTGVHPQGKFGAEQLKATFTPDAGHSLDGLTAGALTITVWYAVLA